MSERLFTASEVIRIAEETSDSLGNLYRMDFVARIEREGEGARVYYCICGDRLDDACPEHGGVA